MRAVASPCPAVPAASPRARQSTTRISRSSGGPSTTPARPVINTKTAASDGLPPICSATPIAIGVVTDFGASDSATGRDAPSARAIRIALPAAVTAPARMAGRMAKALRLMLASAAYIGTAKATVAGPSRK